MRKKVTDSYQFQKPSVELNNVTANPPATQTLILAPLLPHSSGTGNFPGVRRLIFFFKFVFFLFEVRSAEGHILEETTTDSKSENVAIFSSRGEKRTEPLRSSHRNKKREQSRILRISTKIRDLHGPLARKGGGGGLFASGDWRPVDPRSAN